jgi:ubiquitin C-terminal hydrolase
MKKMAKSRTTIERFPRILIITLGRFSMNRTAQGGFAKKIQAAVDMPASFNAS